MHTQSYVLIDRNGMVVRDILSPRTEKFALFRDDMLVSHEQAAHILSNESGIRILEVQLGEVCSIDLTNYAVV